MLSNNKSLPEGTELDQYVIQKVISRGGFSIVYVAVDTQTKKHVVIKEYMPSKLAHRDDTQSVVPLNDDTVEHYNHGRRLFLQEATALAGLKHANIVNVINFFSGYGTVYMVMDYVSGKNLQSYVKKHRGYMSEKFLLTVFPQLLRGLKLIHAAGFLHLDIKPGNIHLRPGGKPILLDFGAVHQIMRSRSKQVTQVVTPGYSPVEQYNNNGYVGPWSDIYAIGATMRCCIEGQAPMLATERHERDTMRPATKAFKGKYSEELLKVIDMAMEVDPLLRPQCVDDLLQLFPKQSAELANKSA